MYALLLESIGVYHAENGLIRATLPVQVLHFNSKGTLDPTLSTCLVDWGAGYRLHQQTIRPLVLARIFQLAIFLPRNLGDTLEIEGKISRIGKTLVSPQSLSASEMQRAY